MTVKTSVICTVEGCSNPVQKPGYPLCRSCWEKSRQAVEQPRAGYAADKKALSPKNTVDDYLSPTALGEILGLNPKQTNRVLFELGWIEKDGKGWKPTVLGEKLKAQRQIHSVSKVSSVRWLRDISKSRILQNAAAEFLTLEAGAALNRPIKLAEEQGNEAEGFRSKFPPTIRTSDGHMVRSRGEAMIDAWLYENRIVHAYERLVRSEEKMYCDFYLPQFDLYIEYWGLENDPKYRARKETKIAIYKKNELRLVEIKDEHIDNLDDYLTARLSKFGFGN